MKILLIGSTGFIGKQFIKKFADKHQIFALARKPQKLVDYTNKIRLTNDLKQFYDQSFDAIINLAGEPIATKLWTNKRKQQLIKSRVDTTKILVELLEKKIIKTKILINSSALGFYGDKKNEVITEVSKPNVKNFTYNICKLWEQQAKQAEQVTKVAITRFAIVLGHGGYLAKINLMKKLRVGYIGSGEQYFSWIHINDLVKALEFIALNQLNGVYNLTSPNPIKIKEFYQCFYSSNFFFNMPELVAKLVFGQLSQLFLDSIKAYPINLAKTTFCFEFPRINDALSNLKT